MKKEVGRETREREDESVSKYKVERAL